MPGIGFVYGEKRTSVSLADSVRLSTLPAQLLASLSSLSPTNFEQSRATVRSSSLAQLRSICGLRFEHVAIFRNAAEVPVA